AGPEAGHLGGARHALELGLDFLFDVVQRDGQIDAALQAGEGFNHRLHEKPISVSKWMTTGNRSFYRKAAGGPAVNPADPADPCAGPRQRGESRLAGEIR